MRSVSERRSHCSLSSATARAETGSCQKGGQCSSKARFSNFAAWCPGKVSRTLWKHSLSTSFFFFFFCTKLKFHTISLRGEQKWRKNAGKAWPLSFKAKLWCPHRCRCTPIRERQHFCQKSSHRACPTHREGVGLERAFPSPVWAGGTAGPGAYYRFPSRWVRHPQWAGCWQQCSLHSAACSFWNELQMVKTSYEKHLTGRGARCTKATPAALQRCTAAEGNALTWSHRHLRILPSA